MALSLGPRGRREVAGISRGRGGVRTAGDWGKARDAFQSARNLDDANALAAEGFARADEKVRALQQKQETERTAAESKSKSEADAVRLLEAARPVLDQAVRYQYEKEVDYAELTRRAEKAQGMFEEAVARAPDLALATTCWPRVGGPRLEDKAEACWRDAIAKRPGLCPGP